MPGRTIARLGGRLLLAAGLIILVTGAVAETRPAQRTGGISANVQADGARQMLEFLEAVQRGERWDDARLLGLLSSAPYHALIAHHSSLDPAFTEQALLEMLRALQEGSTYASASPRLQRMYAAYHWALEHLPMLRQRLALLTEADLAAQARRLASAALPAQAQVAADVWLLADGYSPAYIVGQSIVLDVLQVESAPAASTYLAHELHRLSAESLLPPPCPAPVPGQALDLLAIVLQEGAASYYVDYWLVHPTQSDYAIVVDMLISLAEGRLTAAEREQRLDALLAEERGPLYRVGAEMIARLTAARGKEWVLDHLGDPVSLLRAYIALDRWPQAPALLQALASRAGACPAWFASRTD